MIRKYGKKPYQIAVIHGGPGDIGSLGVVARTLSSQVGVLEPIQSKFTVWDLVDELEQQLTGAVQEPITLLGHSWGAWLAVLYTTRYPALVKDLILVGSGPFEEHYVPWIEKRRLKNLTSLEQEAFHVLLTKLKDPNTGHKDQLMRELGALVGKTDNVQRVQVENEDSLPLDGNMYTKVWHEAAELRKKGILYDSLCKIHCSVCVLHGQHDPHPLEGVIWPLRRQGIPYELHVFEQCGHAPFQEKFGQKPFYEIVLSRLAKG